jgi:hypothetical protein
VPATVVHGLTGGELIGAGFARDYATPTDAPPNPCPTLGRRGEILVMSVTGETTTCTVKPGTPIFIFGLGGACSDVEPPPFFGVDEAAQRACARQTTHDFVLDVQVSLDGGAPVEVRTDRFEAVSPQMTFVLPENNGFGLPAGTVGTLVADVYVALVRNLPPGRHTIVSNVVTADGSFTTTLIVDVVPGA